MTTVPSPQHKVPTHIGFVMVIVGYAVAIENVVVLVVVLVMVLVATFAPIRPQDPSSSPEEEAGSRTQCPESEDQDVPDPQQKQSRQQMGLPQDTSPEVLGARDKDFDG